MLKNKKIIIITLIILALGLGVFALSKKPNETSFVKNGQLSFIKDEVIKTIDIEIADNDIKRRQGLMWRQSMSGEVGMLFIYENENPLSFWMRNTYISLDIIFVNQSMEIVMIKKNTIPLSQESILSEKPAKFAVEVVAGFCDNHQIEIGDKIKFEVIN